MNPNLENCGPITLIIWNFCSNPEWMWKQEQKLIQDFIEKLNQKSVGIEPYPIALRGINWIKFLSKSNVIGSAAKQTADNSSINASLYAHYHILLNSLEYHLLGNHLLEDGFSLIFSAFYFKNKTFYKKAKEIIETELTEQILADGAHFELSPMYHQIILERLLDCINLIQNNQAFKNQDKLLPLMRTKAEKMLTWLNEITFSNGDIPLLNDSAPGIAPTTKQLNRYANSLNLQPGSFNPEPGTSNLNTEPQHLQLSSSGYRRFNSTNYECIIDIGQIGPTYQPGHAHADTFNFVLNRYNESFIIDPGISTYEANETRLKERGTEAHNTVTVSGKNSSEVWSSFRVAKRAKVEIISDHRNLVTAEHNGYRKVHVLHQRSWTFDEKEIRITDKLKGKNKEDSPFLVCSYSSTCSRK